MPREDSGGRGNDHDRNTNRGEHPPSPTPLRCRPAHPRRQLGIRRLGHDCLVDLYRCALELGLCSALSRALSPRVLLDARERRLPVVPVGEQGRLRGRLEGQGGGSRHGGMQGEAGSRQGFNYFVGAMAVVGERHWQPIGRSAVDALALAALEGDEYRRTSAGYPGEFAKDRRQRLGRHVDERVPGDDAAQRSRAHRQCRSVCRGERQRSTGSPGD